MTEAQKFWARSVAVVGAAFLGGAGVSWYVNLPGPHHLTGKELGDLQVIAAARNEVKSDMLEGELANDSPYRITRVRLRLSAWPEGQLPRVVAADGTVTAIVAAHPATREFWIDNFGVAAGGSEPFTASVDLSPSLGSRPKLVFEVLSAWGTR